MKLTEEQEAIRNAYVAGEQLVVQAGAGTGKTSTLIALAEALPQKRATYIAFNKSIQVEAAKKFGNNVTARTAHSLAYAKFGRLYAQRLNAPRVTTATAARFLGVSSHDVPTFDGQFKHFNTYQLVRIINETVANFCRSDSEKIEAWHVPLTLGIDPLGERGVPTRGLGHFALAEYVLPFANVAWEDLKKREGKMRFTHDHYLKMYALSKPVIQGNVLFFDEAQDANPVIKSIVMNQDHLQKVLVGDENQAIYGFTGALDAMGEFAKTGATVLPLTQSFRFGQAVADSANEMLGLLGSAMKLRGFDQIPSRIEDLTSDQAAAVLCRTNAGTLQEIVDVQHSGKKAALVGGIDQIKNFVIAAIDLQERSKTNHPELMMFTSWDELRSYVENDADGGDLATLVKLVENNDSTKLLNALNSCVTEAQADVTISTAHKAKGREWNSVKIGADFSIVKEDPTTGNRSEMGRPEQMLAYVALTRAEVTLDPGCLMQDVTEIRALREAEEVTV